MSTRGDVGKFLQSAGILEPSEIPVVLERSAASCFASAEPAIVSFGGVKFLLQVLKWGLPLEPAGK